MPMTMSRSGGGTGVPDLPAGKKALERDDLIKATSVSSCGGGEGGGEGVRDCSIAADLFVVLAGYWHMLMAALDQKCGEGGEEGRRRTKKKKL